MGYSLKFREEVMEYIDGFHTHVEVAKLFHISEKTIRNWIKQRKETGNLKSKTPVRKAFKLEKEALSQYVKEHPDAYLREIASHFKCGISSVHRRLESLGITLKKKFFYTKKERRRNDRNISRKSKV